MAVTVRVSRPLVDDSAADWKDGSRNHILSIVDSASNYYEYRAVNVSYINIRRD